MDWLINIAYYVIPFVLLLGVLVFVHEFGHYIMAKMTGVKVDEFSVGFGKQLVGYTDKSGTLWKICAIPLGGYCKFLGDGDASSSTSDETVEISEEDKKYVFNFQNPFKKLAIVVAGPAANYIFAILIFASVFFFLGRVDFPAVVGEVIEGGAAQEAGILVNDKILSVNDIAIESFDDLRREISLNVKDKVKLEIKRGESDIEVLVSLKPMVLDGANAEDAPRPSLGVKSINLVEVKSVDISLFEAISDAGAETWRITDATLRGVGQMITGKRGSDEVGGILRIAEMSGDISKQDGWLDFLIFTALLSINLGLINLFPIPVLDGGHVVIYLIEIVTRREINEKFKEYIFKFGLFLILALMVFATYNDIARLITRWF